MRQSPLQMSIRLKLTALVAGLVLVTVFGLSVAAYLFARRTLHGQIHARLVVVASDRQKLLLHYIQQQEERVNLIASRRLWREYLGQLADGQTPTDKLRNDTQQSLLDSLRGVPELKTVWIVDLTGRVVLATEPTAVGRDFAASPEFKAGLQGTSFLLEEDDPQDATITLTAPAIVGSNRVVGVVFMVVDHASMTFLLKDRTGMGVTGEAMLGIPRGEKIHYLLEATAGKDGFERPRSEVPAMAAAVAGQTGFMQTKDYRRVEVLAAYRPVGYRNWGLVAKIDVAEVYAPIRMLRNMFILVELAVFGLVLICSFWLATRFTTPILRLAKMADSIAGGGLHAQVVVETNDEIGHLGLAFNKMSQELSHSYAILEERVTARTAELKAEQELLQSMMDTMPDMIYFKDRDSKLVRVNRAKALNVGATDPAQVVGLSDFDHFPHDEAQRRYEDEQRIIATGQPIVAYEESETNRKGEHVWMSSTKVPRRDANGLIVGTLGISRDITDRKHAEEQLERYFQLTPDLFCIAGFDGYFKRLSPSWAATLGYTTAELLAQPYLDLVHPDDRAATINEATRLTSNGQTIQFENRYRCKDGSYRWLQWNAVPVIEQKIIHAVARDVSEHKRAQELLSRFADALNKKNLEMQEDLKLAREVHQVFVPERYPIFPVGAPAERSALRFAHRYLPTSALGGDFFDIIPVSATEAGILICDVMGHGMRAALVTSIIRGLTDKYRAYAGEPGEFLGKINQALVSNLKTCSATIFATAYYLVIDVQTGRVRAANAGHPTPLVMRTAAKLVERLDNTPLPHAPALGLMNETVYATITQALGLQDRLVLYTDGIYEVEAKDGQQFGVERLEESIRRRVNASQVQMLDELLVEARLFAVNGEFTDDVCLLSVELASLAN